MTLTVLIAGLLAGAPGASWLGPKPPAHPARVATLAPSLTELVQALGAGSRLVGVSKFDDDPAVAKLPRLGGLMDPSPEAILAVKPELLVVQPSPTIQPLLERVAELGVSVLELPMSNVAEVQTAERELGTALGEKQKGDALAAQLESSLAAARAKIPASKKQRALIVYGWSPLVVAGPGSFADELLRAAGGDNAAAGAKGAYVTYSAELAADSHPDLLVDSRVHHGRPDARGVQAAAWTGERARGASEDAGAAAPWAEARRRALGAAASPHRDEARWWLSRDFHRRRWPAR